MRLFTWLFCAALVLSSARAVDTTIETISSFGNAFSSAQWGGTGSVRTFGQTFTAPAATRLNAFTFLIENDGPDGIDYQAFVYAWDGSKIVGDALFIGTVATVPSAPGTVQSIQTSTGSLPLAAGQQYVAFLTTTTTGALTGAAEWGVIPAGNIYPGGKWAYANADSFSGLSAVWEGAATDPNVDLAFRFDFSRIAQTISFAALPAKTIADAPFALTATASSGLPVTYFSTNSGVATVNGNMVTVVGLGQTNIFATQAGDATYSAAPSVLQPLTVTGALQPVSFPALPDIPMSFPNPVINLATITAALPLNYFVSGTAQVQRTGNVLTILGPGSVTITAGNVGNGSYAPANDSRTFNVTAATSVIHWPALPNITYTTPAPTIDLSTITSSSGHALNFGVGGPVTRAGNILTITGAGQVTISVGDAGGGGFSAVSDSRSFLISPAAQVVTWPALPTLAYAAPGQTIDLATITNSAPLPLSFGVSGPVSRTGNTLTITGAGVVTIIASSSATSGYSAVSDSRSFQVSQGAQMIHWPALPNLTYAAPGQTIDLSTITNSAPLPLSYGISGPVSRSGNILTVTGPGIVSITASSPATGGYAGVSDSRSFQVSPGALSITWPILPDLKNAVPAPTIDLSTITVSGPGSLNFGVSGPVSRAGNILTVMGSGAVTITATGIATGYTTVSEPRSFVVTPGAQHIIWPTFPDINVGSPATIDLSTITLSSGLPLTFGVSGPVTRSGNILTITGPGTVTISATNSDPAYQSVFDSRSFAVATSGTQPINWPSLPDLVFSNSPAPTFDLSTITNGAPLAFAYAFTGGAVRTGNLLTITDSGPISITVGNAGGSGYSPLNSTRSFNVSPGVQTISWPATPDITYSTGPVIDLTTITSSAGLPMSFAFAGPATRSGNFLFITGTGPVTITASNSGTTRFAAVSESRTFDVGLAQPTVTWPALPDITYATGMAPIDLSGLTISPTAAFTIGVTGPAVRSGNNLIITGAGTVTVTVSNGGSTGIAALNESRTFNVAFGTRTVTWPSLPDITYSSTASIDLSTIGISPTAAFTLGVAGPATRSGNTLFITGTGLVTLTVNNPGDSGYFPLIDSRSFNVAPAPQVVNWPSLPDNTVGGGPISLASLSVSSGLGFTLAVSGPASLSGSNLFITGSGLVIVSVTNAGGSGYLPLIDSRSFVVSPGTQTVNWPALPNLTYTGSLMLVDLSSLSINPPGAFNRAVSGPAFLAGSNLQITGAGVVTVTVSDNGGGGYAALSDSRSFTVSPGTQVITFPPLPNVVMSNPAPTFNLSTITNSVPFGLSYNVTGPVARSGNLLSIQGAGTVSITASQIAMNGFAAVSETRTFDVTIGAQTISFGALPHKVVGDAPFSLSATASSGLPVVFTSSNPEVATVSGTTVTVVGAGVTTIRANQPGSPGFTPAPSVPQTLTVDPGSQTITFGPLAGKTYGDADFALAGSSSSGLTVTYTTSNPGVATVAGNSVHIAGAGPVTITAHQAGNGNYTAALDVAQSFTVAKAAQTINFTTPTDVAFANPAPTVHLSGSATSLLPVTFTVTSGPATILGTTLTPTGGGTVIVTASQAGNANYLAALDVEQTFDVTAGTQTITFPAITDQTYDSPEPTLSLAGYLTSAGLPVTFSVVSGPATIAGTTLTMHGAGAVNLKASHPGNADYAAAETTGGFTVNKGGLLIAFLAPAPRDATSPAFDPGATTNGGLPVVYSIDPSSTVAQVNASNEIEIIGAGDVDIRADATGDANWNDAPFVTRTLHVDAATQTVDFPDPLGHLFSEGSFVVSATASSGLTPVTFSIISGPATIAAINDTSAQVTPTGVGPIQIEARQAGDAVYSLATAMRNVIISAGEQSISFGALPVKAFDSPSFVISASATSGLPVTFTSSDESVATVSGSTVSIVGVGATTITAHQPGDGNWQAATDVPQTLTVNKASQSITFPTVGQRHPGDTFTLAAASTSGLPVAYAITGGVATLTGNTVVFTTAGFVTIQATQAGDAGFDPAPPVTQTVSVKNPNSGGGGGGGGGGNPEPSIVIFYTASSAISSDTATGTATVTVRRSITDGAASVSYRMVDGTARDSVGYTASTGLLTFAAGVETQTVSIPVLPGAVAGQTFTFALFGPSAGAQLGDLSTTLVTLSGPPMSIYQQYALYKYQLAGELFAANDTQNAYEAYAYYFYFLYLDEADKNPTEARTNLNEFYRNMAIVYFVAYRKEGNLPAAYAWYNYLLSFVR